MPYYAFYDQLTKMVILNISYKASSATSSSGNIKILTIPYKPKDSFFVSGTGWNYENGVITLAYCTVDTSGDIYVYCARGISLMFTATIIFRANT